MADAVSRLPTYGSSPVDPDLDVPGLMVETKVPHAIIAAVDTASWTELDTDHDDGRVSVLCTEPVEVTPISVEEIRGAQEVDTFCKQAQQEIESGKPSLLPDDGERGSGADRPSAWRPANSCPGESANKCTHSSAPHTLRGTPRDNTDVLHSAKNILLAYAHGRRKALLPIVPRLREGAH